MKMKYNIAISPSRKQNTYRVEVDKYVYLEELWQELEIHGYIEKLKNIPQLGNIKVLKKLQKSRYDYVMLQLYLHQFVRQNINIQLKYSYSNNLKENDLQTEEIALCQEKLPTIADAMQILVVSYNIGHFYNTFSASRAVVLAAFENEHLKNNILANFTEPKINEIATAIISQKNYQQFHLLNSLIILQKCDQQKPSVKLAQLLICKYMEDDNCISEKLSYIFEIFKSIRSLSYFIYDLPISKTPLFLDVRDKESLKNILSEKLNQYNNRAPINAMFLSIAKLLDDSIYNENSRGIALYQVSQAIKKKLNKLNWMQENYGSIIDDQNSILNCKYPQHYSFDQNNILKITFDVRNNINITRLFNKLDKMNFVKVGYYDRNSSSLRTILVSIDSKCTKKTEVAFRILKEFVSFMQTCKEIKATDPRYILVVKYFLYYLLGEQLVRIIQTVDEEVCLFVSRGKKARIEIIDDLLRKQGGTVDERHEVEFSRQVLSQDVKNDTSIVICSSIVTFDKIKVGKKLNEYDGLILFPFRSSNQIVFLESKNTTGKPKLSRKCLKKKLDKISIEVSKDSIIIINHDCYYKHSIC